MKNTANATTKPAVVIGSEICYRNKSGSYSRATVKDIIDSEQGEMVVLTFTNKAGEPVEFRKLLKNVWVYTGKRGQTAPAEPALAEGDEVFYAAKSGKPIAATVVGIEGEVVTIKTPFFGGKNIQRNLSELFRTREECEAAQPVAA